jgi:hypothetical protein
MHDTKIVTLLAAAARTSTATGSSVGTGSSNKPITESQSGYTRHMQVFLDVTAAASGTLDLTIEGSVDGGTTWIPLTASSAWTQVTTSVSEQVRRYDGPIPPVIRAVGTGASTPNHTYSVRALLGG